MCIKCKRIKAAMCKHRDKLRNTRGISILKKPIVIQEFRFYIFVRSVALSGCGRGVTVVALMANDQFHQTRREPLIFRTLSK